jgi:hypothetical protein
VRQGIARALQDRFGEHRDRRPTEPTEPPSYSRTPQEGHAPLPPEPLTDIEKEQAKAAGWSETYFQAMKTVRSPDDWLRAKQAEIVRQESQS